MPSMWQPQAPQPQYQHQQGVQPEPPSLQEGLPPNITPGWNDPPKLVTTPGHHRLQRRLLVDPSINSPSMSAGSYMSQPYGQPQGSMQNSPYMAASPPGYGSPQQQQQGYGAPAYQTPSPATSVYNQQPGYGQSPNAWQQNVPVQAVQPVQQQAYQQQQQQQQMSPGQQAQYSYNSPAAYSRS